MKGIMFVELHDGTELEIEVTGTGPHLLLPVDPVPVVGEAAETMRAWGADPELGRSLIDGLSDVATVVAFPYERHVLAFPKPDTLTPSNVVADVLAVADAAGAATFAYYGYSWLACVGLQLALRTARLSALVMGGFPPLGGPYDEMLAVTDAAHRLSQQPSKPVRQVEPGDWSSAEMTLSEEQTCQFVTLYRGLEGFDDRVSLSPVDYPRIAFSGTEDQIVYAERWGGVTVDMAGPLVDHRAALEEAGWEISLFAGLDHNGAMQASQVVPLLRSVLTRIAPP